jgi:hypothetical protein
VLRCITDTSAEASKGLGMARAGLTKPEQLQQLLALRGMLGCDLLLHALQKRHLVEYGRWAVSGWAVWDRDTGRALVPSRPERPPAYHCVGISL